VPYFFYGFSLFEILKVLKTNKGISVGIMIKHRLHHGPMFSFLTGLNRCLTGLTDGPPLLGDWIIGHLLHVGCKVISVILPITKKSLFPLMQPNTVVADVALFDSLGYPWPAVGVKLLLLSNLLWLDPDHHSHPLHSSPQI